MLSIKILSNLHYFSIFMVILSIFSRSTSFKRNCPLISKQFFSFSIMSRQIYRHALPHRQLDRFCSSKISSELYESTYGKGCVIECTSAEEMMILGSEISELLDVGDLVLLRGDLGAGKTTFVRGIVQNKLDNFDMIVSSPSYLLDNAYEFAPGKTIHHMDLYRLPAGRDMSILGFPGIYDNSICLIEWPQRLGVDLLPESYLAVDISILSQDSRQIELKPIGKKWMDKLQNLILAIEEMR